LLTDCEEKAWDGIEQEGHDADVNPMETPLRQTLAPEEQNYPKARRAQKTAHEDHPGRGEARQCQVDEEKRGSPDKP
jgi:hypothetical protein